MRKPSPLKKIMRWLPGLIVSIAAVLFMRKFISLEDLMQAFKAFTLADIAIIIVLDLLSFVTRSLGWKNLLEDVSFKDAFLIVNEGYLFNNLIPRSGEIVRTLLVSGVTHISAFQVASSVLVERAVDVVIAATMFLLTLPLAVEMTWIKPIAWVLFIGFLAVIILLVILARRSEAVKKWLAGLNIKSAFVKDKVLPQAAAILDGLGALNDPVKFARSLFWLLMSWACWIALIYFGITRISGQTPLWRAFFTQSVLALGIALPSAPAGLGVYEGAMVAALSVFNIDQSSSLSIALVLHFTQILVTAIFGVIGLMSQGQSVSALIERISARKPENAEESTGE